MKKLVTMKDKIELYITHRNRLGYTRCGVDTGLLKFAEFVDQKGYRGSLTIALAIEWATASKKSCRSAWARRLDHVRKFAKYYQPIDPKTEIPPSNIYGSIYRRPNPYIYSDKEVQHLIDLSNTLKPINGIKPITFRYLLGLLSSTGLRISEAIHLKRTDVDLSNGVLTIKETKCHKSRYVPLHITTTKALKEYAALRDKKLPASYEGKFFITDRRKGLCLSQTEADFRLIREKLGLNRKARLYDFRHTFACKRLLKWYKEGKNINNMMIYLSTYLGHVRVTDTYWYISAIPELMSVASKKFECCSVPTKEACL